MKLETQTQSIPLDSGKGCFHKAVRTCHNLTVGLIRKVISIHHGAQLGHVAAQPMGPSEGEALALRGA